MTPSSGYSPVEIDAIQARWGLRFPPDLVEALRRRRCLLDGTGAFDWLLADPAEIRRRLDWPFEVLWFDVWHSGLWDPAWGDRSGDADGGQARLRSIVAAAPRLIPLYGHRYLPEEPCEAGNPVFSVWQSDIIVYGTSLPDWRLRETEGWDARPWPSSLKRIRFWSDLAG